MIENLLDDYKNITEKIIKHIGEEEKANILIEKRQEILNSIFSGEVNVEVIKEIYLEKGLLKLDSELKNAIENERLKVKEEIKNIHKIKSANYAYEKNRQVNNFFNTKI